MTNKKTKEDVLKAVKNLQAEGCSYICINNIVVELKRIRLTKALKQLEAEGKVEQLPDGSWKAK